MKGSFAAVELVERAVRIGAFNLATRHNSFFITPSLAVCNCRFLNYDKSPGVNPSYCAIYDCISIKTFTFVRNMYDFMLS